MHTVYPSFRSVATQTPEAFRSWEAGCSAVCCRPSVCTMVEATRAGSTMGERPDIEWQLLEREPLPEIASPPPFALAARELVDALEGRATISSTGEDGRASLE